jgi:hypothetical protein
MAPLLDRVQAALLLLAELLRLLRPPAATLAPLLRACATSLGVEGQALLQDKAARLLAAAFRAYPAQVGLFYALSIMTAQQFCVWLSSQSLLSCAISTRLLLGCGPAPHHRSPMPACLPI